MGAVSSRKLKSTLEHVKVQREGQNIQRGLNRNESQTGSESKRSVYPDNWIAVKPARIKSAR